MEQMLSLLAAGVISGTVIATIIELLNKKRSEEIISKVKNQYDQFLLDFKSRFQWKEKSISELLGPINIQLKRTKRAYDRYNSQNLYLEANVLKEGNKIIRDLLLNKSYLIPNEIQLDAELLIEHYDRWLEEFNKIRNDKKPDLEKEFVFVGPSGYPFPSKSAETFQKMYLQIWNELYGDNSNQRII